MKALVLVSLLLAFGLHSRAAHAFDSGNEWMAECDSPEGSYNHGLCLGEVAGAADGITGGAYLSKAPPPYCVPDGGTYGQIQAVVYKYLVDHPAKRHLRLTILVYLALSEAFPSHGVACPGDK